MSCLIIQFLDVSVLNKVQKSDIDDFSDSGVNHATTTFESSSLHTVDVIAAALTEWFERSKAAGSDPELTVRTYDLKSAYRQIGLSKKGRERRHALQCSIHRPNPQSCFDCVFFLLEQCEVFMLFCVWHVPFGIWGRSCSTSCGQCGPTSMMTMLSGHHHA